MLAGGAAHATPAPGRGTGGQGTKGRGRGRLALGVEKLLELRTLKTLDGASVGLITNPTGVDQALTSTIDLLIEA